MRARILILSMLLSLYGCGSERVRDEARTGPADSQALALYDSGRFADSAAAYLELARGDRGNASVYRLSAADALIEDGQLDAARAILDADVPSGTGDVNTRFYHRLLTIRIALAGNQAKPVELQLEEPVPDGVKPALLVAWHSTRAEFYESRNRYLEAVMARAIIENHLNDPGRIEENARQLWAGLNRLEPAVLGRIAAGTSVNLRPWLELLTLARAPWTTKADLQAMLATWSTAHPQHPANISITAEIVSNANSGQTLPAQVALLLPLGGAYTAYSEQIRDGFLSAWFEGQTYKPRVRIYDADAGNISEMYQKAIDDGAGFIVGPLEKEAVRIIAGMQPVPVSTLALNQIEAPVADATVIPGAVPNLVQFGLPPEDEAREVARRGILEGYNQVLIITVADEFGNRVVKAFTDEWLALGGKVLEQVSYDSRAEEFITPIKQLLNIDSSESRISLLRQRLGRSINAAGRLRNDIDFIFMVASNLSARQIVPHLRFFRADGIPVYTISNIYNGAPDPLTDMDLNGVEFVDMPWVLENRGPDSILANQQSAAGLSRYYAFGIDAFKLISNIRELASDPGSRYSGATGNLALTETGMIRRYLNWAKFIDGQPRMIQPAQSAR